MTFYTFGNQGRKLIRVACFSTRDLYKLEREFLILEETTQQQQQQQQKIK